MGSDVWMGLEDEAPFFHTMAGAAVATPRVVAIAVAMRAESFMVRVRVVLGCARSNILTEQLGERPSRFQLSY